MTHERLPPNETPPGLTEVLQAVDNYFDGVAQEGGRAYRRIRIPLPIKLLPHQKGLFPIVGYMKDKSKRAYSYARLAEQPEATPQTLEARGLVRRGGSTIDFRGWYASLEVNEYQDAQLKGTQLQPKTDERLIEIKAYYLDSEGRTVTPAVSEALLISSERGLFSHKEFHFPPGHLVPSTEDKAITYGLVVEWLQSGRPKAKIST